MSTTAAPYGLIPVKKVGGQPYVNASNTYKIASGYATSIFNGDVVKLASPGGTVQKDTGTTTATPIGVFVGCSYTDPVYGLTFRNYWPASTVAADAVAYVVDDPDVIFKIQGDGLGTIYGQESIGTNAALVQTAGSTVTGKSAVALDSSTVATTAALPLKIVGFDRSPLNALTDTYVDFYVIFNTHAFRTALGNSPT